MTKKTKKAPEMPVMYEFPLAHCPRCTTKQRKLLVRASSKDGLVERVKCEHCGNLFDVKGVKLDAQRTDNLSLPRQE